MLSSKRMIRSMDNLGFNYLKKVDNFPSCQLQIAFDAIIAHGGTIKLSDSQNLGGLKVEILIPI